MRRISISLLLVVTAFLIPRHPLANPDFRFVGRTIYVSYVHSENISGKTVRFPSRGAFTGTGNPNRIQVDAKVRVSLLDLQGKLEAMLRPMVNKTDDCGDVIRLQSARLRPDRNGRASVDVKVNYARWLCTYARIPEVKCKDTWIHGPFGMKTKGVPQCTTTFKNRRTSKNRVIETGISGSLLLTPTVQNHSTIKLSADVTNLRVRNDLARFIVDVLGKDLRKIAQAELESALGNDGAVRGTMPRELRPYLRIDTVEFSNAGDGKLAVLATGKGTVTAGQIFNLCRQNSGFCR